MTEQQVDWKAVFYGRRPTKKEEMEGKFVIGPMGQKIATTTVIHSAYQKEKLRLAEHARASS